MFKRTTEVVVGYVKGIRGVGNMFSTYPVLRASGSHNEQERKKNIGYAYGLLAGIGIGFGLGVAWERKVGNRDSNLFQTAECTPNMLAPIDHYLLEPPDVLKITTWTSGQREKFVRQRLGPYFSREATVAFVSADLGQLHNDLIAARAAGRLYAPGNQEGLLWTTNEYPVIIFKYNKETNQHDVFAAGTFLLLVDTVPGTSSPKRIDGFGRGFIGKGVSGEVDIRITVRKYPKVDQAVIPDP